MQRGSSRSFSRAVAALAVGATLSAGALVWAPSGSAAESIEQISSDRETVPGSHTGDTIDDPAIWVHPTDPSRSLVIANDKGGSLDTYDLDGSLVQRIDLDGVFWGNVDVRQDVTVDGTTQDLVGASQNGERFYTVDPSTRQLVPVTENSAPIGVNGEGFCMYQSPVTQKVYGFAITRAGVVNQFELTDPDHDGLLSSTTVRTFSVGSEAEGCVADDDTGALYISEEDVALWRYGAEPGDGSAREAVDLVTASGGHLAPDIEGLTLVHNGDGHGYLFASAQNGSGSGLSYFGVYRLEEGNDFVKTFRIVDGAVSDDCDHTDGVAAVFASLGDDFPKGMFVCQDNNNDAPGASGNQDVKMTRLDKIVDLDAVEPPPPPPPPPPSPLGFVDQATFNANAKSFPVTVPTDVQPGDTLLLFASQSGTSPMTGLGAGWTQIGRAVDDTHVTTIWQKTAAGTDPGSTVRLTTAANTYLKAGLTLAAYRGVDPGDPVATISGAPEPASTAAHTTPVVADSTDGAWRVSYWSDKNGATTSWTAPPGETRRATTLGTGGGRVDTLLTDSGAPVPTGSQGGLTATTNAAASTATSWTLLLRPADQSTPPPTENRPPTARFTYTCDTVVCDFDGSTSSDPEDGTPVAYSWNFGDGGTSDEVAPRHDFGTSGSRQVTLTVTDSDDASDTDTQGVAVDAGTTATPIGFVGQASAGANAKSLSVKVPAGTEEGDALLLFASQANTVAITGPGAGWTQVGRTTDTEHATTVWRRVATASDAGKAVKVSVATLTKMAATIAAYDGTDTTNPVATVSGVAEPGSTKTHKTPVVTNADPGAWRVSYWSDRNSATTAWTAPSGEARRASVLGTGGGRVDTLLTDSGAPVASGAQGGLTATANAVAASATSWTLLLRPASTG